MEKEELTMLDVQQISLEILKMIDDVCRRQGFRYTLAYGTLIGAIRHKGFIPWDDDIDIQMPRPDYERFIQYMYSHPIENLKTLNHRYIDGYPLGISRICDMRYKVIEPNLENIDEGVFVDVYPIDGLGNTYEEAKHNYRITDKLRADLLRFMDKRHKLINFSKMLSSPRFVLSGIKLKMEGLHSVQRKLEKKAKTFSFSDSEYVGIPNWNWIQLVYKREWYEEFRESSFEGIDFKISTHYDDILRAEYGDYMKLPPVNQRVYHHGYKAYKR